MKEKKFAISLALFLLYLGALWGIYFTATLPRIKLTGFDAVAEPDQMIELKAKVERDVPGRLNPDLEGVRLRFQLSGVGSVLEAVSNGDGMGTITHSAPSTPGLYPFRVQLAPADDYAVKTGGMPPALLVLDPEVPVLVCDLDETVTTGGSWRLLLSHDDLEPMPGAAQVLSQLTRSYQIIFLTARDDTLLNESRDWLARRGFPRSPVVGRDWSPGNLSRAGDFKERLLVAWKKRFPHIALGIGNSQGDCQAYRAAGIPHFMIGTSYCPEPDAVECMVVDNWADIPARLAERAVEKPPLEKSLKNKRAKEND